MVSPLWLYTGLIALVGLERLFELRLSARNAQWAFARGGREAGREHYPVMAAFHASFLAACVAEPWLLDRPFVPALGFAALTVAALTQALRYWVIATLGPRWNTRVIVLPGWAPVTAGPYRFLKHPNYLAVVLELLALPLVHSAWLTALVFSLGNLALLRVRIRVEETALGEPYARAFGSTRAAADPDQ